MGDIMHLSRVAFVPVLLGIALSGCALGRSTVAIDPTTSSLSGETKGFAKIMDVQDLRRFEPNPREPSQPSLGEAADLSNPAITARAVARKRGGFGNALGDVVLPEGSSVAGLVRSAAQKALQDRGYQVVDGSSPYYANAAPLSLDINQFWAWFTPGFVEVTIDFTSSVALKGEELVGSGPAIAEGRAHYGTGAVFESTWKDVIQKGLTDLADKMAAIIRAPSGTDIRRQVSRAEPH